MTSHQARCERQLRTALEALIKSRTLLSQILTIEDDHVISEAVDHVNKAVDLIEAHDPDWADTIIT